MALEMEEVTMQISKACIEDVLELARRSGDSPGNVVADCIASAKWLDDVLRGGGRIIVEEPGKEPIELKVRPHAKAN